MIIALKGTCLACGWIYFCEIEKLKTKIKWQPRKKSSNQKLQNHSSQILSRTGQMPHTFESFGGARVAEVLVEFAWLFDFTVDEIWVGTSVGTHNFPVCASYDCKKVIKFSLFSSLRM